MAIDLQRTIRTALDAALKDASAAPPEPKKPLLSTGRAMLLGAGLMTAGRVVMGSRGRELLGSLEDRLQAVGLDIGNEGDEEEEDYEEPEAEEDEDFEEEPEGEEDEDFEDEEEYDEEPVAEEDEDFEDEEEYDEEPVAEEDEDFEDEEYEEPEGEEDEDFEDEEEYEEPEGEEDEDLEDEEQYEDEPAPKRRRRVPARR